MTALTAEPAPHKPGRKRQKEHRLPGKLLRMPDPLWDFLEARRQRTGMSIQDQLRQLVEREAGRV